MKTTKKLTAYNDAIADFTFAMDMLNTFATKADKLGTLAISSSLSLNCNSSDKQFIYALGIISNQMIACNELHLPDAEYRALKETIIQMYDIRTQCRDWDKYTNELRRYVSEIHRLLSDTELFTLLDKPTKL